MGGIRRARPRPRRRVIAGAARFTRPREIEVNASSSVRRCRRDRVVSASCRRSPALNACRIPYNKPCSISSRRPAIDRDRRRADRLRAVSGAPPSVAPCALALTLTRSQGLIPSWSISWRRRMRADVSIREGVKSTRRGSLRRRHRCPRSDGGERRIAGHPLWREGRQVECRRSNLEAAA